MATLQCGPPALADMGLTTYPTVNPPYEVAFVADDWGGAT